MPRVNPAGTGESVHQMLILEGPIIWRDPNGNYHKITLVEDPENAGTYILTDVENSPNVPTS